MLCVVFFFLRLFQVILTGIGGGMVACICTSSTKKHEFLLYCSISVLILNTINLIYLEFGQLKDLFGEHIQKQMSIENDLLDSQNGKSFRIFFVSIVISMTKQEKVFNF